MRKILSSVFLYPALLLTGLYEALKQKEFGIALLSVPFLMIPILGYWVNYTIAIVFALVSFPICFFIGAKLSK